MATIILTQQETLLPFELDESQIEMVKADVGGSYIERSVPHNTGYNGNPLFVTQTPAQIAQQAESLIALNISKTGDQYTAVLLNGSVNHFGAIQANDPLAPNGISRFEYFHNGSTMEIYLAQESKATIGALLQQIENGTKNPVFASVNIVAGPTITSLSAADAATGYVKATIAGVGGILRLPTPATLKAALNATDGSTFQLIIEASGANPATLNSAGYTSSSVTAPSGTIIFNQSMVLQITFGANATMIAQLV